MKELTLPLSKEQVKDLHAGDSVSITGVILTARDCAHKRIMQYIKEGRPLPCKARYGFGQLRSHYLCKNGQLCPRTPRFGTWRNDRQGRNVQ